jgi:hypothetical protein
MTIKDIAVMIGVLAGIYANLAFQDSLAAGHFAEGGYQGLHQPSPALRASERRGRITIYDQIPVAQVERVLDEQFERIDSLMFVRTQHPVADGGSETDDDCD